MPDDNTEMSRITGDVPELDTESLEKTIELDWGDENDQRPIDGTIVTQIETNPPVQRSVVVSERRVSDTGQSKSSETEYELIRVLGQGGMGVVYQARQTSIDRLVAVKMLKPVIATETKRQRKFINEAAVTGDLDHPNIVPIYDLGKTSDGRLFYAMKDVRGTPWKNVLHGRSELENLRVLLRVADAVAFAHSRGVIHRDLKPENIMLGEFGEVLVMDWGLAITAPGKSDTSVGLGGTPCYMAPEMVMGSVSDIGPRCDVYLLGAILFEIVTGRPPHSGRRASLCLVAAALNVIEPTTQQGELIDLAMRSLATNPADRFSSVQEFQEAIREYQSHTESIAGGARAHECLREGRETQEYDYFARALFGFQNAIELWDGNSEAHSGRSETRVAYAEAALIKDDFDLGLSVIGTGPDENQELRQRLLDAQHERDARKQRLRKLRRTALSLAMGLVLVMSFALFWIMKAEQETRKQEQETRKQRDIAVVQRKLARDAVDQMLTEVGQEQLEYVPQMQLVRRNLLTRALDFYKEFLKEQPDDPSVRAESAEVYYRVAKISVKLGRFQEAEDAYIVAIGLFQQLRSDFPREPRHRQRLARSHNFLGELYRKQGESQKANVQYKLALELQRVLVANASDDTTYRQEMARTSYNLGLLYWSEGKEVEARDAYDSAIGELSKLVKPSHYHEENRQGLARAFLNRGILNQGTRKSDEARQDYDRAIALFKDLVEAVPQNTEYRYELATVFNRLGNLLLADKSKHAEAEQVYGDSLTLLESLVDDFPSVLSYRKELGNSVNGLAASFYYKDDFAAAEQMWKRLREIARKLVDDQPQVPENHTLLGQTLGNLGTLKLKQKEYQAARQFLEDAIINQQAALKTNPNNPQFRIFLRNYTWTLAEAHLALKEHEPAALTYSQSLYHSKLENRGQVVSLCSAGVSVANSC